MPSADVQKLIDAMKTDLRGKPLAVRPVETLPVPVRVIDCVLSLNRSYESVVWPRVKRFADAYPQIQTCADLRAFANTFPSPAEFLSVALNTNDAARADALVGVVEYLIEVQRGFEGPGEEARLRAWAIQARPGDHLTLGVRGFGLAGFQYLRLLLGADTIKPDVRIIDYVRQSTGSSVSDVQALMLLEDACRRSGRSARDVDGQVWEFMGS